jgi:hypothetical protein
MSATALSRHPCRSAHSASSTFGLHPSRVLRCLSLLCMKIKSRSRADQGQIKSRSRADQTPRTCGSELAHEGVGTSTAYLVSEIKHSRASSLPQEVCPISNTGSAQTALFPAKAGPTKQHRVHPVGPASAGKLLILILIFIPSQLRHRQSRLGCRLNAGLAQWAEPHGCGESCPPPWMADGSGPTERDRSEGTLTKEGPNQEQALLLTFGAFQK